MFFIFDEAPLVSIRYRGDWKLIARDAFNGKLLWKRNIPLWSDHLRHFRAGPVHITRRLAAVGDKVYVTLGLDAPVSVLDAATGKTLMTLKGSERTEEIAIDGGIVYLAVGTSEVHRKGGGFFERDEPKPTEYRYIAAYDAANGKRLWRRDFTGTDFLLPTSLTVRKGSVFYQDINGVGRLDAKSGKEVWEVKRPTMARRMSFASPTVVATDDILLVADRVPKRGSTDPQSCAATDKIEWGVHGWNESGYPRKAACLLVAYSVADGKELWSMPCSEDYNAAVDVFVVGDTVYVGAAWQGYDLKSGKARDRIRSVGDRVGMAHHRCYRNKASVNYMFTGRSGIEVVDLEKGWVVNNSWIRGTCQYGILPANGMLYAPPDACGCFNKVKVQGFFAAGPKRELTAASPELWKSERLIKGSAYGEQTSAGQPVGPSDWPMHRQNAARSGSVKTTLPPKLGKSWSAVLGGRLTQPVSVDGTTYVAQVDAHTVHALNADTGKPRWHYTAGGRIDSAPTFFNGMLVFGSADGRVTCLRAADGALVWEFLAAPTEKTVCSYGQLESAWPVHGSVLVQDDTLYVTAGRNSYLDGGIVFYKMDPASGKVLTRNVVSNFDPETGKQLGPEGGFDMAGVNTDILSGDGRNIFMKQERFDADLKEGAKDQPHLFGIHGFLGEEWFVRSYWLLGTNVRAGWGGWASGNETTFGRILCFDESNAYGYGRTAVKAAATGHREDTYRLFGCKKVMMVTGGRGQRRRPKKGKQADKAPPVKKPAKPSPTWSLKDSLIVRAMVLTDGKLVVAGPPDLRKKSAGLLAYDNEAASLAAFKGERGVSMRVISTGDGKTLSECELDAPPVFDGMSAANGRVFVALKNGAVECWAK